MEPPAKRLATRAEFEVTPVWLDCDPGHDDAFAIWLCCGNPAISLLGISTVAGNQSLDLVTQNALDCLSLAGREETPVARGSAVPLVREPLICPEIHGTTGLDCDIPLPKSRANAIGEKKIMFEWTEIWIRICNSEFRILNCVFKM